MHNGISNALHQFTAEFPMRKSTGAIEFQCSNATAPPGARHWHQCRYLRRYWARGFTCGLFHVYVRTLCVLANTCENYMRILWRYDTRVARVAAGTVRGL